MPKIDPCVTPALIDQCSEQLWFTLTNCCLFDKYDLKNCIILVENMYNDNVCSRMSWSTKSKAFRRSRNTEPMILPESISFIQMLNNFNNALIS